MLPTPAITEIIEAWSASNGIDIGIKDAIKLATMIEKKIVTENPHTVQCRCGNAATYHLCTYHYFNDMLKKDITKEE